MLGYINAFIFGIGAGLWISMAINWLAGRSARKASAARHDAIVRSFEDAALLLGEHRVERQERLLDWLDLTYEDRLPFYERALHAGDGSTGFDHWLSFQDHPSNTDQEGS